MMSFPYRHSCIQYLQALGWSLYIPDCCLCCFNKVGLSLTSLSMFVEGTIICGSLDIETFFLSDARKSTEDQGCVHNIPAQNQPIWIFTLSHASSLSQNCMTSPSSCAHMVQNQDNLNPSFAFNECVPQCSHIRMLIPNAMPQCS